MVRVTTRALTLSHVHSSAKMTAKKSKAFYATPIVNGTV